MTDWPLWDQSVPEDLLRYVQTGTLPSVMPEGAVLPGRSAAPPEIRLRRVFDAFAAAGTDYADESFAGTGRYQHIRPPDEVFTSPRHANCLDLSVAFAGACLDAGLHPVIAILDPAGRGAAGHAVVVVWLRGDWAGPDGRRSLETYPLTDVVLREPPEWPGTGLRSAWQAPGEFVAVDITVIARRWRTDPAANLEEAVASGAAFLSGDRWRWRTGLDVGLGYDPRLALAPPQWPQVPPLEPAYHQPGPLAGPLAHIRARNRVVRFEDRGELDALLLWCRSATEDNRPRLAAITGVGGSGKTRLAAELADQLTADGWHAGFLREDLLTDGADDTSLHWLARVASPLLVVVDYVEAAPTSALKTLIRYLASRRHRTAVILTSRDTGDWFPQLDRALDKSGVRIVRHPDITLAEHHPNPEAVYRRAHRRFSTLSNSQGHTPLEPPRGLHRWTTLDLVVHAWIAAHSGTDLPTSRTALYDAILDREFDNWNDVARSHHRPPVPRETLRRVAAGLSLLTPTARALTATLSAFDVSEWTSVRPAELAEMLRPFLRDTGDNRVALRPDPVADHLIAQVFGDDPTFFDTVADLAARQSSSGALVRTLTRAADHAPDVAGPLADRLLAKNPALWPEAFAIALTQNGPFVRPLEKLAAEPNTVIPLAALVADIPAGHSSLRNLALIAATRTRAAMGNPTTVIEEVQLAHFLNNLATRHAEAGNPTEALTIAIEAVARFRGPAELDPALLPNLAVALASLANRQAERGRAAEALETINEAIDIQRELAADNPGAHLHHLASSLNSAANKRGQLGDLPGALADITEAVALSRDLVTYDPVHLPSLAMYMTNLANRQAEAGRAAEALEIAVEAVGIQRKLAADNPGAHLPVLAVSLTNLANHFYRTGDHTRALATAGESVDIYRRLVRHSPDAYLPELAVALNNLGVHRGRANDLAGALATISEAADIKRELARKNPDAYSAELGSTLNNLAGRQAEAGDHAQAQVTVAEAVSLHRRLAEDNPIHLPELAKSLAILAVVQQDRGAGSETLAVINQAVTIQRALAANSPTHLPDLALFLGYLADQQARSGDHPLALASITEAVAIRRDIVEKNGAAHLPELASTLNKLANLQAKAGEQLDALATATEAAEHYRELAENHLFHRHAFAVVLGNLSIHQADTGHVIEALATATEAVATWRGLVEENGTIHLPGLASALSSLANRQAEVRDKERAMNTAVEDVTIHRALAEKDPAHLPDLAMSLNNLANREAEAGNHARALTITTEALAIRRELVKDDPTHLPDLAASLNNLANRLLETGQRIKALEAAIEAVDLLRGLVHGAPAHLPDLALALTNLANHLYVTGDRTRIIATAAEAVALYRRLAAANPAHLSNLAAALNNLSIHYGEAGDQTNSLTKATEAIVIRRRLAEKAPAAHLPDLANTLKALANRQTGAEGRRTALATWEETWASMPAAGRAYLMVQRHLWRRTSSHGADEAADDLSSAASHAEEDSGDLRFLGEVRRMVREAAVSGGGVATGLPAWATAPVDDSTVALANAWTSQSSATAAGDFLRQHWETLRTDDSRAALATLCDLYPDAARLLWLKEQLDDAVHKGLGTIVNDMATREAAVELVEQWITSATLIESQRFLEEHPALVNDPLHTDVLVAHGDSARSYLGIVQLARYFPVNEVFDAILDGEDTRDLLFKIVAEGNLDLIRSLWFTSPHLANDEFAGVFAFSVIAALGATGEPSEHVDAARVAKSAANEPSRKKAVQALKSLVQATGRPEVNDVLNIFEGTP
ncbi:hypothetical protein ADK67_06135 [Saccharothrix sp. NRRL B-16348]|uniref:tetratricopeptide repeat protein n=1 Tax=Saccharothrix sp. NRRL B-16348 TaxID=1415542 RepID=UPI0006AF333A|nr:tetratricopeptide repeat protein [Saccharothrix sp. NRRL B-16348]KOX33455.1 hypothetical protein ADK67_06135 [Saccharothrix sp. NRRL B-16348]